MPNMFLGFPVPRAKIAEMIEGYAPPLAHVSRHRPPGDDPLALPADIATGQAVVWDASAAKFKGASSFAPLAHVAAHRPPGYDPLALPADIAAGQLLGWDGTKYKGYTVAGGGIADLYAGSGLYFQTFFESLDGYNKASSPANGVVLSDQYLSLTTQGGVTDYAGIYKDVYIYTPALTWAKKASWKASVRFLNAGYDVAKAHIMMGNKGVLPHVGFRVNDSLLKGTVGNGSAETLTTWSEYLGDPGYMVTRRLEVIYLVSSCEFWVDGAKVATLTSGLPTTTQNASWFFRAYIEANGSYNPDTMMVSFFKAWKEI